MPGYHIHSQLKQDPGRRLQLAVFCHNPDCRKTARLQCGIVQSGQLRRVHCQMLKNTRNNEVHHLKFTIINNRIHMVAMISKKMTIPSNEQFKPIKRLIRDFFCVLLYIITLFIYIYRLVTKKESVCLQRKKDKKKKKRLHQYLMLFRVSFCSFPSIATTTTIIHPNECFVLCSS